jgi:hypothetical protein
VTAVNATNMYISRILVSVQTGHLIRDKLTNKQMQPVGALLKVEFGDCHAMSGIFINSPLHDSYCNKLRENVVTDALPLTLA